MRNKGKVLVLMLSAAALVAASVFGTMAYLTDEEAVTNTFTVGQVGLDLDELDVDNDNKATDNVTTDDGKVRDKANEYHLLPGHEYVKDPTVHIDENSESCWVFVKVTNEISAIEWDDDENYTKVADQITTNGWTTPASASDNTATVYYKQWTKPTSQVEKSYYDLPVFANFKIDGDSVTNTVLGRFDGKSINVTAYAVQLDGFNDTAKSDAENAQAAWETANFN